MINAAINDPLWISVGLVVSFVILRTGQRENSIGGVILEGIGLLGLLFFAVRLIKWAWALGAVTG